MSTWFRCDSSLARHPKTFMLAEILGVPLVTAGGHVAAFFGQVALMKPDGLLDRCGVAVLADMALWTADPEAFVLAMVRAGFLVRRDDLELEVHGWLDRNGRAQPAAERREARKQKPESQREMFVPAPALCEARVSITRAPVQIRNERTNERSEDSEDRVSSEMERPPSSEAASTILLRFPAVGQPREWMLTQAHVDEFRQAFETIDIIAESRRALVWIRALPKRRKTCNGYKRFLFNWFSRVADRGTATGPDSRTTRIEPPRQRDYNGPEQTKAREIAWARASEEARKERGAF